MKIVIDIGHPAEVHYFRNLIKKLEEKKYEIQIFARDKEVTYQLLRLYDIPFIEKGKGGSGVFDRVVYTISSLRAISRVIKKFKPDLCISHASPYLAIASAFFKIPHVMFNDTEKAPLFRTIVSLCKPSVYSPDSFLRKDINGLQLVPSYMELAYLHPETFNPDETIKEITGEDYVLLRFVANKATHDIGIHHMDEAYKRRMVVEFSRFAGVWISSEGPLPDSLEKYRISLPPNKMHDVIANASLVVGDSATMSAEAAVLGVPSVFINDNCWGYIRELNDRYGLVHYFKNNKEEREKAFEKSLTVLKSESRELYIEARKQLLTDKKNLSKIMLEIVEETVSVI